MEFTWPGRQNDNGGVAAVLIVHALKNRDKRGVYGFSLVEKNSCTVELRFKFLGYLG